MPRKDDNLEVNPLSFDSERGGGGGSCASISSWVRFGGSLGNSVWPQAGAFMRLLPVDWYELTEVVDAPRPRLWAVAAVECEASEVIDSIDGRGEISSVGLRGGNAGRLSGGPERAGGGGGGGRSFRVGNGGGTFGLGFSSGFGEGVGGGRVTGRSVEGALGSFPMDSSRTEPFTW